jgi:flagellar motor switch protein FliG
MARGPNRYNETGLRKAAILMVGLGAKASSQLMKELTEVEIEAVTKELAKIENVPSDKIEEIQDEFRGMVLAQEYIAAGGVEYAREILEAALGPNRAIEIIRKVQRSMEIKGFNVLKKIDAEQLLSFMQQEHPQTIAFVLTQIDPEQAADIISHLPDELRNNVMYRYATMDRVPPDLISEVEAVLESSVDFSFGGDRLGGVKAAADILNMVGTTVEKHILEDLGSRNPELSDQIKKLMFVFEDLRRLDDRSMQRILKDIDLKDLAMALKAASDEIRQKIFANISQRAAEMVKEEIQYMGPVRLSEVEKMQQQIVDQVRKLADSGEVVLSTQGRQEDVLV